MSLSRQDMLRLLVIALTIFIMTGAAENGYCHIDPDMPDGVALMEYQILLDFEPDNHEMRNKLGMIYIRKNELNKAEEQFQIVLKKNPRNFNAVDGLGLAQLKQKNYNEALTSFNKAITINPDDMMVYFHLGQLFEETDRPEDAQKAYFVSQQKYKHLSTDQQNPKFFEKIEQALNRISSPVATPGDQESK